VLVDGVLFTNGELFGTDGPDYAQDLNIRAAMAARLAADARKLLAEGDSRPATVANLERAVHDMPGKEGVHYRSYLGFLGSLAAQKPDMFDGYLESLDHYKLPAPIVVKRWGGMNAKP
jgi:hypothetical protein